MKKFIGALVILTLAVSPVLLSVRRAEAGTIATRSICYTGGNGPIGYVIYVPYYFALRAVLSGKASFTWGPPPFEVKSRLEFCDVRLEY